MTLSEQAATGSADREAEEMASAEAHMSICHFERNPCSVRLAYHKALKPAAEQRAARLAEIRAYLESL